MKYTDAYCEAIAQDIFDSDEMILRLFPYNSSVIQYKKDVKVWRDKETIVLEFSYYESDDHRGASTRPITITDLAKARVGS